MSSAKSFAINLHIFLILQFLTAGTLSETKISTVTCDFDLEDIVELLPYLPSTCMEIYNNRKTSGDGGLYDAHLAESQAFAKFSKKLDDYEMRSHRQNPQDPFDEYPFDELLRKDIYGNSSLNDCPTNETDIRFLNCARDNHILKDQLVPIVSPK